MIHHELLRDQGILIVTPEGPLEKADFEKLALAVDPYIAERGGLKGLMIYSKSFPGWDSFAGLMGHIKFVKEHQRYTTKVAAVTDSKFLSIMPRMADHFSHAQIKHFEYDHKADAMKWLEAPAD